MNNNKTVKPFYKRKDFIAAVATLLVTALSLVIDIENEDGVEETLAQFLLTMVGFF